MTKESRHYYEQYERATYPSIFLWTNSFLILTGEVKQLEAMDSCCFDNNAAVPNGLRRFSQNGD